jgi:hypothetical protein
MFLQNEAFGDKHYTFLLESSNEVLNCMLFIIREPFTPG